MEQINSLVCRVFFGASFVLVALALLEKLINVIGYTITGGYYTSGRLLEFAGILLMFVVALLLREIREVLKSRA